MTHGFPGRKRLALLIATVLLATGLAATSASAAVTFSNRTAISIPDEGDASPYPSSLPVGVLVGSVQKATVTLHGFSHTCPNDVAVLLVGPTGANSILLSHPGPGLGCPDSVNADLTFDQGAASNVPYPPVTGTWKPTEEQDPGTFNPPAPPPPYPVDLNVFNGTAPNGTWQLFVNDTSGGDSGSIAGGWSLTLTGPTPVNTFTVGKAKLNKKKGTATIPVTVPNPGSVTLSGKGVVKRSSSGASKAVAVTAPGTVKLLVKAKGKTRTKLNFQGKAKVKANITYTPNSGAPNKQTKKIKLKKTLG